LSPLLLEMNNYVIHTYILLINLFRAVTFECKSCQMFKCCQSSNATPVLPRTPVLWRVERRKCFKNSLAIMWCLQQIQKPFEACTKFLYQIGSDDKQYKILLLSTLLCTSFKVWITVYTLNILILILLLELPLFLKSFFWFQFFNLLFNFNFVQN